MMSLRQTKCKAIKDLEQGMSNKDVTNKSGVPRNTVSTWFKNKEKLLSSLEKGRSNLKRKKLRTAKFEDVDKAVYLWFAAKRSQQIPIDGVLLKEKTVNFAHDLGETEFKASI